MGGLFSPGSGAPLWPLLGCTECDAACLGPHPAPRTRQIFIHIYWLKEGNNQELLKKFIGGAEACGAAGGGSQGLPADRSMDPLAVLKDSGRPVRKV